MAKQIALMGDERIAWSRLRGKAGTAVARAVKMGRLTNLKTNKVKCSDCDRRATMYDHRDYTKPLEVEPVCASCNIMRGTNARRLERNKIGRPQCPKCDSFQVLFAKRKKLCWCRVCGHEWRPK